MMKRTIEKTFKNFKLFKLFKLMQSEFYKRKNILFYFFTADRDGYF